MESENKLWILVTFNVSWKSSIEKQFISRFPQPSHMHVQKQILQQLKSYLTCAIQKQLIKMFSKQLGWVIMVMTYLSNKNKKVL